MRRTVEPVAEEVVRLRANGHAIATWTCSPTAIEALGAGRLLSLGFLTAAAELLALGVERENGVHTVTAELGSAALERGLEELRHRRDHGCGPRYLLDCRPDRLGRRARRPPPLDPFPALFRALFEDTPSRRGSGGHHTAALSDGVRLLHAHEEVGRHNGVDKALGEGLLSGSDLASLGLLTTARISAEIAEKAARAGVAWVASRSVPTTLAVELARAAGIPLVARAAGPDARVLTARGAGG